MANLRPTSLAFGIAAALVSPLALADDPLGAPPADATALVAAPTAPAGAPDLFKPNETTNVTLAAGGQYATGNSQLLAGTVNGKLDLRRDMNGFGASLLGNYGQGAASPAAEQHVTAENLQGRIRYDRYLSDRFSVFLIDTERHDRFQGLSIRTNIDPGVKYLFIQEDRTTLWGELGYDFQYDVRRDDARPVLDATTGAQIGYLAKTATQESGRLYVGFKHAFNSEVTFTTGLEYLQAFSSSTPGMGGDYRINYDALFAANVGGGFSLGAGFTARYDHVPLSGKEKTDTATTFSLIYSFSKPAPAATPTCPCPPPPPPPDVAPPAPPVAAPASAPPGMVTPPPTPAPGTSTTTSTTTTQTTTTTAPAAPAAAPPVTH